MEERSREKIKAAFIKKHMARMKAEKEAKKAKAKAKSMGGGDLGGCGDVGGGGAI